MKNNETEVQFNPDTDPLISVEGLEKHFKDLHALRGVDIDIYKGEVIFVVGPSGSGKSTFLRCLNRLEEPTKGDIFFEDIKFLNLASVEFFFL